MNAGDFVLDIGNVTETITVEADSGRLQIQTESGERSDMVTNKQLRDIALNGRNIVDLMKLVPGRHRRRHHHHVDRDQRGGRLQHQRHAQHRSTSTPWTGSPT